MADQTVQITLSEEKAAVAERARLESSAPVADVAAWAQARVDDAIADAGARHAREDLQLLATKFTKADPATRATVTQALSTVKLEADVLEEVDPV